MLGNPKLADGMSSISGGLCGVIAGLFFRTIAIVWMVHIHDLVQPFCYPD